MSEATKLLSPAPKKGTTDAPGLGVVNQHPRIIYSTIAAEEVKLLATRHYNFLSPLTCTLYQRGYNDIYQISSSEQQFALRISPVNGRPLSAIMTELAVVNHIHAKGIEVALPVARADGGWITEIMAPEGLRKVIIFNWVNGSVPQYNLEAHTRQLGRLLGRIHTALDDITQQSRYPTIEVNYLPKMSVDAIRIGMAPRADLLLELTELASRLEWRLNSALKDLTDWGLCHGDIKSYNAHVDGDRCVLFDFEFCGWGCRLFDLASYRLHARFLGFEKQAWHPFIEEYLALRPDAESSLKHIGLFMCLRLLWGAARHAERLVEMGIGSLPDILHERLVPYCREIESELL